MTVTRALVAAGTAFVIDAALFIAALVLSFVAFWTASGSGHPIAAIGENVAFAVATFSFGAVGALVAWRRPRNATGWVLMASGLSWQLNAFGHAYSALLALDPSAVARADLVSALTTWLWVPAVGLVATLVMQLFPDGRPLSRGWRPLVWLSLAALAITSITTALDPGPVTSASGESVPNPIGLAALDRLGPLLVIPFGLLLACIVASAASVIRRFWRSRGIERQQLRWLSAAAIWSAGLYLVTIVLSVRFEGGTSEAPPWLVVLQYVAVVSFATIPIAAAIAILRYRLYDIDIVIERTLVYGALTALLGATYVVSVIGMQTLLSPITTGNATAVVISTLLVAGLFQPLRARIRMVVDRRFYRARYDAQRTLDTFSRRLRDEVDLATIEGDLLGVVDGAMRPAGAWLWLRGKGATDRPS